jgi:hypothetical protein
MADTELLDHLTNKVGPLPAWMWAAIPAVGYIGWSYYRASSASDTTTTTDTTTTDGGAQTDPSSLDYGLNLSDGTSYLPSYSSVPDGSGNLPYIGTPGYTNDTWSRQAINFLITQGVTAADAVTAINAYINGVPVSVNSTQMSALQRAIVQFGPAPTTAFIPTVVSTTPTPPTATAAVTVPEAPTNVAAVPISGNTAVRVTWGVPQQSGNAPLLGFKVELYRMDAKTGKGVLSQSQLAASAARIMDFRNVIHKTWYHAYVTARNSKGYGAKAFGSAYVA